MCSEIGETPYYVRRIELKNWPFHYLADPFVICRNNKNYCFVEDFNYLSRRGSIAVYELTDSGESASVLHWKKDSTYRFHICLSTKVSCSCALNCPKIRI